MAHADALEIEAQLLNFIQNSLEQPIDIGYEERLIDRGYIPSMQLIALVVFLEETFDVVVEPFDVTPETFESIASIAAYVREQRGEA